MKNLLIPILIFFTIFQAMGQSPQKLKLVTQKRGVRPRMIEKYYIDKAAYNARTGKFEKFKGKNLVQSGYYKNNLRDSIWTDYSMDGKIIAQGKFQDDKKIGLWYYLSFKGDTIQIYNHSERLMVFYNTERENELFPSKIIPTNTVEKFDSTKTKIIVEKMPIFIGGTTLIQNTIITNLAYPILDAENGFKGISKVSFIVNKEGKMVKVHTKNSISEGLDKEAIRLIELLGDYWEPGEQDGKKVNVEFTIPLTFKIE